jgi:hypothetical protein
MKPNTTVSISSVDGTRIDQVPEFFQKKQLNGFEAWSQLRVFDPTSPDFEKIMNSIVKLNGEALRVLLGLLLVNAYRNKVVLSHAQLGDLLKMKRQNVGRAFRALVVAGFLVEQNDSKAKGWSMSEEVAWRGRGSEHRRLQSVK